jgi:hypothetical protein
MPYLTPIEWAALYGGVNILILLALSWGTIAQRRRRKIALGDAGDPDMHRAIRAHANAAEYIPAGIAGLFMLAFLYQDGGSAWVVHVVGVTFTLGRILHGLGLSMSVINLGRMVGMLLTLTAYAMLGFGLIAGALGQRL